MLRNRLACTFALFMALTSASVFAETAQGLAGALGGASNKSDRNYISFGASFNEFNNMSITMVQSSSINYIDRDDFAPNGATTGLTGQTYGVSAVYGSYLDETFRTEFRFGKGLVDDTLDEAKDININYWVSWYMGASQTITDYLDAYILLGISYFETDVTRREVSRLIVNNSGATTYDLQPSPFREDEDLFTSSFSFSWLLGVDYKLTNEWYLSFEYGRLLKDSDSGQNVQQYNTYLKYEF
jgi:opacity protein-like surface antigen